MAQPIPRLTGQQHQPMQEPLAGTPGAPARASGLQWPIAVLSGTIIVSLSAQVAVPLPFTPVPLTLQGLAEFWRNPPARTGAVWDTFGKLSQRAQSRLAAGFQLVGRKPGR